MEESFRVETSTLSPKPSRLTVSLAVEAIFSWPPPNLAEKGACFWVVFSCREVSGTFCWPALKKRAPACSMKPLDVVGSNLPPETGKVTMPPLRVAPSVPVSLTPFAFSRARKGLARLSLVVPEASGL